MVEKCCYGKNLMIFFKRDQTSIFFSNLPFFGIHSLKKSAHSFFGAWPFLLAHIRFTPSEGAKSLCKLMF